MAPCDLAAEPDPQEPAGQEQLAQELQQLQQLQAEAMGWIPLRTDAGESAYLHMGDVLALVRPEREVVIEVVGVPDASLAGVNVVLLGW